MLMGRESCRVFTKPTVKVVLIIFLLFATDRSTLNNVSADTIGQSFDFSQNSAQEADADTPESHYVRFYSNSGNIADVESPVLEYSNVRRLIDSIDRRSDSNQFTFMSKFNAVEPARSTKASQRVMTRRSISGNKFCGKMLVNALQLVCNGKFAKRANTKKPINYEIAVPNYQSKSYAEFYKSKLAELMNLNKPEVSSIEKSNNSRLRFKRGVVDECCKKPCSTFTLTQYCDSQ